MRLVLVATIACVALAVVGGVSATPAAPFIGTWWVIDTTDGSLEQVTFGAGGSMFFRDDSAHVCGGVTALARDVGTVTDDTWTGSGTATLRCPADGETIGSVFFQFTLNPDGTLSSSVTLPTEFWTRSRP